MYLTALMLNRISIAIDSHPWACIITSGHWHETIRIEFPCRLYKERWPILPAAAEVAELFPNHRTSGGQCK